MLRPLAVLAPAVLAAAAACGSATDPAPAAFAPGRFVLVSVAGAPLPLTVRQGAFYVTTLLADTLWLAAHGTSLQAQATSTSSSDPPRPGTSTAVQRTVGGWVVSGAQVRVTATTTFPAGASGADTLVLTPRRDGGLAAGVWVWQRH